MTSEYQFADVLMNYCKLTKKVFLSHDRRPTVLKVGGIVSDLLP